jgi:transcriptional regulator with XRE-family HTH domain
MPVMSQQVRQIIKQSGLSAYRLAKLAGVAPAMLSRFMRGERTISMETLDALAPVLGLRITADKAKARALAKAAPAPGRPPETAKKRPATRTPRPRRGDAGPPAGR